MTSDRPNRSPIPAPGRAPLSIAIVIASVGLAGCRPEGAGDTRCSDEPRRCVEVVSQDMRGDATERRLVLEFLNRCDYPVDMKVCFEDDRFGVDCRERSGVTKLGRVREAKPAQFLGEGIRFYVRYSSEARHCRFPRTDDIKF